MHYHSTKSSKQSDTIHDKEIARVIKARKLDVSAPFYWFADGWSDFLHAPKQSLIYGVSMAIICYLITALAVANGDALVILPLLVCFMFIGPFLAIGLYDISRQLQHGQKPSLRHAFKSMKRNKFNQIAMGFALMLVMIFWARIANIIYALMPSDLNAPLDQWLPFVLIGTAIGAFLCAAVFTISAFSLPLMMERRVDFMTAILSSANAVFLNKGIMLLWAFMIFASVVIGVATFYLGIAVLMPVIGHATWHAYQDVLECKYRETH